MRRLAGALAALASLPAAGGIASFVLAADATQLVCDDGTTTRPCYRTDIKVSTTDMLAGFKLALSGAPVYPAPDSATDANIGLAYETNPAYGVSVHRQTGSSCGDHPAVVCVSEQVDTDAGITEQCFAIINAHLSGYRPEKLAAACDGCLPAVTSGATVCPVCEAALWETFGAGGTFVRSEACSAVVTGGGDSGGYVPTGATEKHVATVYSAKPSDLSVDWDCHHGCGDHASRCWRGEKDCTLAV